MGGHTGSITRCGDGPGLPAGRYVSLPGRGPVFVRELPGPSGAPTLVLLHGWTATADLNWFACFAPLAEHYRVIAPDHRGHGRGLRPIERFRLEDCADDVAALCRQLDLDRVVPVGYSMGGAIAQLLCHQHGDLIAGVVLCATGCTFNGTARERLLFALAAGTSLLAGPATPLTQTALGVWNGWRTRRGCAWWGYDQIVRHDWSRILEAAGELGRFDSRPWIGALEVPAAVVVTRRDDVVPVHRQCALARHIRASTVVDVDGGHNVCSSDPQRFVPALVEACRSVAGGRVPAAA